MVEGAGIEAGIEMRLGGEGAGIEMRLGGEGAG
jgi:hypothetical protein